MDRKLRARIKRLCTDHPDEVAEILLETAFYPTAVDTDEVYTRYEDDARLASIGVVVSDVDGDVHVEVLSQKDEGDFGLFHRFRTSYGGGQSLRVRTALILLALAIKLDNDGRPQER